jgi:hypothetical protein
MRMILWLIFLFSVGILALNLPALHAVLDWIFTSFQRVAMAIVVALSVFLFFFTAGQLAKNRQLVAILSIPAIAFEAFEFFQEGSDGGKVVAAMTALFFSVATIVAQLRSDDPR